MVMYIGKKVIRTWCPKCHWEQVETKSVSILERIFPGSTLGNLGEYREKTLCGRHCPHCQGQLKQQRLPVYF